MLAHWDDLEKHTRGTGHLGGTWTLIGDALGCATAGVRRIEVAPGKWSTPAHAHGAEEELFFVLAGSGLSWQDGETYEVGAGDCLVHLAGGPAHTLRAGDDGLDVLAFGERIPIDTAVLPRTGLTWLNGRWTNLLGPEDHPFRREAEAGPPDVGEPSPRPSRIVNVADVEPDEDDAPPGFAAEWRDLARAAGSVRTGMSWVRTEPGNRHCPTHCHSEEEEIFVVLEGEGTLELVPAPRLAATHPEERHPVRAGHVVSRPAGTRIAHSFLAGDAGLTLLAYGTRRPNDIAYYPRSDKVNFRGVGLITRLEHLDYWDGER